MVKERVIKPIKREVKASYRTEDITDLQNVTIPLGKKGGYTVQYDILSKEGNRLLLREGGEMTRERFEQLNSEIRRAILKDKPSPYYLSERTDSP
jgi:hypothetical protein